MVLVITALASSACLKQVEQVEQGVTVGSDTDTTNWEATWEQAALVEAERLHPELIDLRASRIEVAPQMVRVRVTGAGGYCAIFGGLSVGEKWKANEIGPC